MFTTASSGPGLCQESETPFGSITFAGGPMCSSSASQEHGQEAGLEVEQQGLKPAFQYGTLVL